VFVRRLSEELDRDRPTLHPDKHRLWGTLYVLRKGFEDINATFRIAQFALANQQNPATWGLFQMNRLRVVHDSLHNRNGIDLVLFLNGLPVDKAPRQPEPLLSPATCGMRCYNAMRCWESTKMAWWKRSTATAASWPRRWKRAADHHHHAAKVSVCAERGGRAGEPAL